MVRSELQCVAICSMFHVQVCWSELQYVAVFCSILQYVAVRCSMLQCVAVCCSVLQYVAVCCSVLQCDAVCCRGSVSMLQSRTHQMCSMHIEHIRCVLCAGVLE